MSYFFRASEITLSIRESGDGKWVLWIGDEISGTYGSAAMAADDVYMQATGIDEWDEIEDADGPTDLSEWQRSTQ